MITKTNADNSDVVTLLIKRPLCSLFENPSVFAQRWKHLTILDLCNKRETCLAQNRGIRIRQCKMICIIDWKHELHAAGDVSRLVSILGCVSRVPLTYNNACLEILKFRCHVLGQAMPLFCYTKSLWFNNARCTMHDERPCSRWRDNPGCTSCPVTCGADLSWGLSACGADLSWGLYPDDICGWLALHDFASFCNAAEGYLMWMILRADCAAWLCLFL